MPLIGISTGNQVLPASSPYPIKNTGSGFRFFSIAGVPDEHAITIGTRTGKTASAYKAVLTHLHKGDRVNLRGPIGSFGVKNDSAPVVMIASGVGVTPFRAMALDLTADQTRPIKLIQSAHGFHLFQSDFEGVAQKCALRVLARRIGQRCPDTNAGDDQGAW
ncbi:hypothetical protein [Lacticaseibacillus saniviri]|uniref:hypothetical protein n=1 Tax=Lacticaseibacillus saniviri TaxID=931533 RepID=UPI0012E14415|nr:hypothetical protein [Lacticaseibacillus saniviri]